MSDEWVEGWGCKGRPCDGCGWCAGCNRVVGTPHIQACACPTEINHVFCPLCISVGNVRVVAQ